MHFTLKTSIVKLTKLMETDLRFAILPPTLTCEELLIIFVKVMEAANRAKTPKPNTYHCSTEPMKSPLRLEAKEDFPLSLPACNNMEPR